MLSNDVGFSAVLVIISTFPIKKKSINFAANASEVIEKAAFCVFNTYSSSFQGQEEKNVKDVSVAKRASFK